MPSGSQKRPRPSNSCKDNWACVDDSEEDTPADKRIYLARVGPLMEQPEKPPSLVREALRHHAEARAQGSAEASGRQAKSQAPTDTLEQKMQRQTTPPLPKFTPLATHPRVQEVMPKPPPSVTDVIEDLFPPGTPVPLPPLARAVIIYVPVTQYPLPMPPPTWAQPCWWCGHQKPGPYNAG